MAFFNLSRVKAKVSLPLRAPASTHRIMEEKQRVEERVFHHYQHADGCNFSRWDAKECFEYMYARPWERVNDFYSELVAGRSSLSRLFGEKVSPVIACSSGLQGHSDIHGGNAGVPEGTADLYKLPAAIPEDPHGKWARVSFKIVISYVGKSFDGWQRQPGLDTVQGLIERSIRGFVDDKTAERRKDKGLPVEGLALVAGRTDKGVTAVNQVCSFYTWRKDVEAKAVTDAINTAAPGRIRVVNVSQVSRTFHPNFCAKWRRYLYIFPLIDREEVAETEGKKGVFVSKNERECTEREGKDTVEESIGKAAIPEDELESKSKPTAFSVRRVDLLLRQLEGKLLSYRMFARDTKASRNVGPPTECFLYHARAAEARLPSLDRARTTKVMCVELVANRFLRRMVRVLVATAIREAAAGAEEDILIQLTDASCRRATAPPAPPDGLCLVDVGYVDFNPHNCLIR